MKPISTSTYTFADLINGGYVYVDKTQFLYELVKPYKGVFFLSRPRRFGKSLTISTLEAIFKGRRELFKGLAIDSTDYDWKEYPVIRIDLGSKQAWDVKGLEYALSLAVKQAAENNGVEIKDDAPHHMFETLIRSLSERGQVVVLIDEYDKPILGNVENPAVQDILRVLKSFYSVIKTCDEHLRFAMLTGVSKFSRVSVFSDLNNLTDITMDTRFSSMLGYSQEELETNFTEYIDRLCKSQNMEKSALLEKIRTWYNGYRFTDEKLTVYNPVSIGKLVETGKFSNFWFETGTPSFLITMLKQRDFNLQELSELDTDELGFSAYEVEDPAPEPLLFQTGYLTIKNYDPEFGLYTLSYPNYEVEHAFLRYLADAYTPVRKEQAFSHLMRLQIALRDNDMEKFFKHLRVFFAGVPYDIQLSDEKYYQTVFYLVLSLIGTKIDCEVRTSNGRVDSVIKTDDRIYIFEFKLHGTAEDAMKQIHEKTYALPFKDSGKEILLVGAAFDPETRNIERWLVETSEL